MTKSETVLVTRELDGVALKLHAERKDDRFHSTVFVVSGGDETPLLYSLEGDSNNPWPPSPPLQECLLQTVADRDVILATGMAGKTHWSMSVDVAKPGVGFTWDVACRTGSKDFDLGTSYRLADGTKPNVINNSQLEIEHGSSRLVLQSLPTDIAPANMEYDGASVAVTIQPAKPYPELPGTFRWKYELILRDPQT